MIKVSYNNPELRSLMQDGKSTLYKEISRKRGFLKALRAFLSLLHVIHDTTDLFFYKQYQYQQNVNVSYVHINCSNIQSKLPLLEQEHGTSITITDLII